MQKLQNKSPLLYSLAQALGAFDPRRMADSRCHEVNRTHLRVILKQMNEAGKISDTDADAAQQQYTMFLDEVMKQSSQFATFNLTGSSTQERDRIGCLFYDTMAQNPSFQQLWTVVKQIFLLSHGQAMVEHGFSVIKEIEVENMAESTFAAKRMVCDHVH